MNALYRMSSQARVQKGFSLLEGLIAIALFSFGILGLMGMQAKSIQNVSEAKYRSDASFLANQLVGQIWIDRGNIAKYADAKYVARAAWQETINATLPAGDGTVAVNANRVTVTVTWQSPGASQHRYVAVADINGS